jgi:hypothetical protein
MDESEKLIKMMQEAMGEFRKSSSVSAETLAKLNKAINANTKAQEEQTDQAKEAAKAMEEFKDKTRQVLSGLGSAAQGARENREDFRSLKPAVGAANVALKSMTGALGNGISTLGDVISGLGGVASRFIPGLGKAAGLLAVGVGSGVSALGGMIKKHGKDVVDAATAFMNFSLDETQRVVGAFQMLSKIGGVTGESFEGMQKAALETGLSMDQFARVIAKNSQGLAFAGGSVTQGMKAVVDITKASKGFEDQFLKLGIGFEEQRDLTAQFLTYQRTLTGVNLRDTKGLTEASKAYILQLDELARLTGMSREEAAARLANQGRELKFGAVLEDAAKRGPQFSAAIGNAAEIIEKRAGPQMAKGFKDIFDNMGTKEAQLFFQATGGAGPELVNFLERTGDLATFMERLQQATAAAYETMGGTKYERQVGRLGTYFDPVLGEMRQLKNATDLTAEGLRGVTQEQKDAMNNQSNLTNTVVDAQKNLRDFALNIDKIVIQQFPKMAGAVKMFTGTLEAGSAALAKVLGVPVAAGGGAGGGSSAVAGGSGAGSRAGGGAPPVAPSGDLKSKIMQLESGGRNIGTGLGGGTSSAFGLYQMTRTTFNSLARNAKQGDALFGKTFEQMREDINLQSAAMDALLGANQQQLSKAGVSTKDAAMYMAHVLGAGTASKILRAADNTNIDDVVLPIAKANNPNLFKGVSTVADIKASFDRVTGGGGYQYGGIASGPKSGYTAMLHGTEAVVPLPGGRSIPVEMTGMTDTMGKQVAMMGEQILRFDTMINLLQNNVDLSRKILQANR